MEGVRGELRRGAFCWILREGDLLDRRSVWPFTGVRTESWTLCESPVGGECCRTPFTWTEKNRLRIA